MVKLVYLENLPQNVVYNDIRNFLGGIGIEEGAIKILGNSNGEAFVSYSDAVGVMAALRCDGKICGSRVVRVTYVDHRIFGKRVCSSVRRNLFGIVPYRNGRDSKRIRPTRREDYLVTQSSELNSTEVTDELEVSKMQHQNSDEKSPIMTKEELESYKKWLVVTNYTQND